MTLKKLRRKIDGIDSAILKLLNQRAKTAIEIGEIKKEMKADSYTLSRELEILRRLSGVNKGPLPDEYLKNIYREILSASRILQGPMTVTYWGPEASFTHLAAVQHFGSAARFVPIRSIAEVFSEVEKGRAKCGVVPIENSTEGVVNYTLDMLIDSDLKICAEIMLKISQNLVTRAKSISQIRRLYTNSQAISQSRTWVEKNLPLVEIHDVSTTAEAARLVQHDSKAGAIASKLAAERYNLRILAEGIEDIADNYTRFLVIGKQMSGKTGNDKTSLMLSVKDHVGALYEMLEPFRTNKLNLTNIESRPSRKKAWDYYFFIDFQGHIQDKPVIKALNQLKDKCVFLKVLGSYSK